MTDSEIDTREITVEHEFLKFPVLSKNGDAMFVLDLAEEGYDWSLFNPVVRVWSKLDDKNIEEGPAILLGDRAVWAPGGEHIAVFWSDPEECPSISVYETVNLKPGSNNVPLKKIDLSRDIMFFQTQFVPRHYPQNPLKILICEAGNSGIRRFMMWEIERNVLRNKIDVDAGETRHGNLIHIFCGPKTNVPKRISLAAQVIEETAWREVSPTGYMLIAEEDVSSRSA